MRMGIGLGVGINRSNYAQGIFSAYQSRVIADGGVTEAGNCVNAVSSLLQSASLLIIPSGYKGGKAYAEIPTNGNGDLTWTRASDAWRTNADGLIQRVPWNLLTYSEELDSVTWFKTTGVSITANATSGPNDTLTADRVTGATGTGTWADPNTLGKNVGGLVTSSLYTASIYLRSTSTSSQVTFQFRDQTTGGVNSIVCNLTSSWQRFNLSRTTGASSTGLAIILSNATADFFAWGAQLNEGSSAQTYFPTTDRLNVPRLSYMYGSCPALLLEPQRTNLCLYSQDFDNAWWSKLNATITANSTTAPDGTTTADTLDDGTSSSTFHRVLGTSLTITAGSTYSYSIYVKKNTMRYVRIVLNEVSDTFKWFAAQFDLDNATATTGVGSTAGSTVVSSSITSVGNGWYRCTLVGSMTTTNSVFPIIFASDGTAISSADGRGGVVYNGSSKQLYIYGAQLEAGAYPTTYIPTTTASATRIADSFSRSNIYTNGLITSSGGTWFVELRNNVAYTRDAGVVSLYIGDASSSPTNTFEIRNGGGTNFTLSIGKRISNTFTTLFVTTTSTVKIAIKWNGTNADLFVNGVKEVTATAFAITNMDFLIGNGNDVPKFIQAMALYPTPLSDTDCTTITTL